MMFATSWLLHTYQFLSGNFPGGGGKPIIRPNFTENCMKLKKIGREGSKMLQYTALIEKLLHMADFINLKK